MKLTNDEKIILLNAVEYLVEEKPKFEMGFAWGKPFVTDEDFEILEDILEKLENEFPK